MAKDLSTTPVSTNLTLQRNRELFDKMAKDDAFRAEVAKNPAGALHAYGVQLDPAEFGGPIELPSKEEFAAVCDKLDKEGTPEHYAIWAMYVVSKA